MELHPVTMAIYFYLITNSHSNAEGYYRLPILYAVNDLLPVFKTTEERNGKSTKDYSELIREQIQKLEDQQLVSYDDDTQVILIKDALKLNITMNEKHRMAAIKRVLDVPYSTLIGEFLELAEQYDELLANGIREGLDIE
jgi:hypothetical protein